ncbi:chondroitinase family polysaccharide lyase [Microbacterium sp. NPDC089987]|uniref:chondroitinase family polysaccharide lyase n=1 Tax=Microbacterium sp. NPDC089987 TaxID=3364202 RepID=UPI0037FC97D3
MQISRRGFLVAGAAFGSAALIAGSAQPALASGARIASALDPADVEARALALSPSVFLLETHVPRQFSTGKASAISISGERGKVGAHSLKWEHAPGGVLTIKEPLRYQASRYTAGMDQALMGTVDTFSMWVYNAEPTTERLRVEFGRGATTDTAFEFGLDFTGWRTCWVRLGYDTEGTAHHAMNRVRFIAPRRSGTLFIDQVVLNTEMRPDHPTPDRQAPFVQPEIAEADNRHWLDLMRFDDDLAAATLPAADGAGDLAGIRAALLKSATVAADVTPAGLAKAKEQVAELGVPERASGAPVGPGSYINGYQSAILPADIRADVMTLASAVALRAYGTRMRAIAAASAKARSAGAATSAEFDELYLRMYAHLEDQGFAKGSAQGTIHHIGYQYREAADSFLVAQPLLTEAGLWRRAMDNLAWFVGLGRLTHDFSDPAEYGGIIDVQNTLLKPMAICAVGAETDDEQCRLLAALTRFTERSLSTSPGIEGGLKPDGTIFHHMGPYPDYGRDALVGMAPVVALLHGTAFRLGAPARASLRRALLTQRLHANTTQWPIALTGRHPDGEQGLSLNPFAALAATPMPGDGGAFDPMVGAAFLRLLPPNPSAAQRSLAADLREAGIEAEPAPNGHWALGYAACGLHRRDEWLVALRGHNRYLWSSEIYATDNLYGRYLAYASVEVLAQADGTGQITHPANGYVHPGWDWNRIPGATTKHLPWEMLKGDLSDTIEIMPLTRSAFGGAGAFQGEHGIFGMHLIEHPKFDPTHTAKVSRFSFDDVIVCLGSDIANDDTRHTTETTLFQVAVPAADGTDGAAQLAEPTGIVDPLGNGFHLPAGQRLRRISAVQSAPDEKDTTTASVPYTTALIDHGTAPTGAGYEYALLVGAGEQRTADFTKRMGSDNAPYAVVRKDATAHVVHHRDTSVTGAVVFANATGIDETITAVDAACLLMWRSEQQMLALSVTDPDLHLYEGDDPDQFAPDGTYVGANTSYSRPWRRSASAPSRVSITLHGRWSCDADDVTVTPAGDTTRVTVTCRDGASRDLTMTAIA